MHLEKLGLLEKRLDGFIELFEQLVEENQDLHRQLAAREERVKELEEEVLRHRRRLEDARSRMDHVMGVVGRLEELERIEAEAAQ